MAMVDIAGVCVFACIRGSSRTRAAVENRFNKIKIREKKKVKKNVRGIQRGGGL